MPVFLPAKLSWFLASYPSLLHYPLDSLGIPADAKFQVSLLARVGVGEIKIKANSAQLELELGLSLSKFAHIIEISKAVTRKVLNRNFQMHFAFTPVKSF